MHTKLAESSITINAADGVDIPAVFAQPAGKSEHCILFLHGITTNKNEFADFYRDMAHRLGIEGVASLRIDFRGHGDSKESSRLFSITSQVLDTITAHDWLVTTTGNNKIHILASSFGSPPAIFLAKKNPSTVRSLNLICPVLDYESALLKSTTDWGKELFNENTISNAFNFGTLNMADEFQIDVKLLVEMDLIKPYTTLSEIRTPTLIIHGEADSIIPYTLSAKYANNQPHIQLVIVPRMDHGFNDEDDETGQGPVSRQNFELIAQAILENIRRIK